MPVVAIFGLFLILISLLMLVRPDLWEKLALWYIRQPFMHPVEILLCLGVGVLFVVTAGGSRFPTVLSVFGYLLAAVGVGLTLIGPSRHRRFGLWSMEKSSGLFRPMAPFSLAFGVFLVYAAL